MLRQPLWRDDMPEKFFKSRNLAFHSLLRSGIAVEDYHFRPLRQTRLFKKAERKRQNASVLEARHPFRREEIKPALRAQNSADISLLVAVLSLYFVDVFNEIIV